ncbi:UvrD-helicase domain-containing protein [Corynebacterium pyruviciproducens]|uniref:ATP-dependent helicase n=1 Tax=Corynebacterium pyruviciproducens TaxID=598660 RepID=UPI0023F534CF|nr:UvrD-helicase domain-containing protein [Corynebacterium pyruviciproducens]MDK6565481.1 UvrD-helicase domain-containing protein [Corynebacterium pyruviciproducens]
MKYTAKQLAEELGAFAPTPQQEAVIEYPLHNLLVVAGAGAGKTKTMADRVVWLVANGLVRPEQVLGLTFTRKAAQNLKQKIRGSLFDLHQKVSGQEVRAEDNLDASVYTYDAYAQNLVREYGLLLPTEPGARIISYAEMMQIATKIAENYHGSFPDDTATKSTATVAKHIVTLVSNIESNMLTVDDVIEASEENIRLVDGLAKQTNDTKKFVNTQHTRETLLKLVQRFNDYLKENRLTTFSHTMSAAARLAVNEPAVGAGERSRFRVIMLDEYQDTSHSQRILLRALFGTGEPGLAVTAVGDPMQAIYGWRGASPSNLANFVTDFPHTPGDEATSQPPQEAKKLELTTSFRNPADVLTVANSISGAILDAGGEYSSGERAVAELQPREGASCGDVSFANFELEENEADYVARQLAMEYYGVSDEALDAYVETLAKQDSGESGLPGATRRKDTEPFGAAILVRQHSQVKEAAKALERYKVPYHVHSLTGLLEMPEIVDLVSIARALARPDDTTALLRILTGPLVKLGFADLKALSSRARRLNSLQRETTADDGDSHDEDSPVLTHLREEVASALEEDSVALGDALADLGDKEQYTPAGYERLLKLSAQFRWLRGNSLTNGLQDIFQDIENVFGIRTEVLARENPRVLGVPGTSHLDTFHSYVANFSAIDGATLNGFLDYLEAEEQDRSMDQGEQTVSPNRVDIMTVHAAKGLEFPTVAVIGANQKMYGDGSTVESVSTAATAPAVLPSVLAGDGVDIPEPLLATPSKDWKNDLSFAYGYEFLDSTPRFSVDPDSEIVNGTKFKEAVERYKCFLRMKEVREATRLLYVAVTRSSNRLIVTSHSRKRDAYEEMTFAPPAGDNEQQKAKPTRKISVVQPTRLFAELAQSEDFASDVVTWWEPTDDLEELYVERDATAGRFPQDFLGERRGEIERAAELVEQMKGPRLVEPESGEQSLSENPRVRRWQITARKLLEEKKLLDRPVIDVELGDRLTATEIVALKKNPQELARRRVRPVPFKPNSQAKRGTKFHQWIEDRFTIPTLIDEDQLPGMGEEDASGEELEMLKENFLASEWADRTPVAVEQAIEYRIGSKRVTGKIDAVFENPDGTWTVVDWKTGKVPTKAELPALALQLAEYRLAWAEIQTKKTGSHVDPSQLQAVFFYVREGFTLAPDKLLDKEELRSLIELEGQ